MELQQNAFSLVLNVASNLQTENTNKSQAISLECSNSSIFSYKNYLCRNAKDT